MKVYGFPMSPNVRRVLVVLAELGIDHELVPVDLMAGAHKQPDYLAVNPNGRVPTLVDGDLVLWESHAIIGYLAAKKPEARLDGESPAERAEIQKWMFQNAAHFGPAFAGIFSHTIRLPEDQRIPRIAELGRAEAERTFAVLDAALAGREYLVGGRFTLADAAYAPTLSFAPMLGFDLARWPNVAAWAARLAARPSVKKVMG